MIPVKGYMAVCDTCPGYRPFRLLRRQIQDAPKTHNREVKQAQVWFNMNTPVEKQSKFKRHKVKIVRVLVQEER